MACFETAFSTQNDLIMKQLLTFYKKDDNANIKKMLDIINGNSKISLRIVDWFATNYSKKYYTVYPLTYADGMEYRFKVYNDYKLKLKAYQKRRFDPFCRWDRITIPYDDKSNIQTTIGQLNFFKWAIENKVIDYIEENFDNIEKDMNGRNSTAKRNTNTISSNKTRKKREELSIAAAKSIKKEKVEIIVKFD
tara:strand:- start:16 stop:594 length:579 start_codon:yes stop_codon:yes gene_type:complete